MRRLRTYVLLIVVLALSAPYSLWGQQQQLSGTVVSESGNLMPGVTIVVKGTGVSTLTDIAGFFSIQAGEGQVLQFSYVGYRDQELQVDTARSIKVTMQPGTNSLDEVIVVGYGKQRRGNITGAVTNVNMDNLKSRPIADVGRGLQGVVPGLSIRIPSGEVGSDPLINIRGFIGSVQGSSQPLILVDNVEVPSIQDLNPNDVESVTILKDAASASIYGAKAAFGVILITTKQGTRKQGTDLTYSSNLSWQMPFKDLELAGIDGLQYTLDAQKNMKGTGPAGGFWRLDSASLEKAREWQRLYGNTVKPTDPVVYGRDWYFNGTDKYGYRIYDPIGTMIKKYSFTQNHNISLNGRANNTTYNIGFGYLGQEGMMKPAKHDDFTRYTANLKVATKVNDFITVRGGALYSDRAKRYPNSTNTSGFGADPWLYLYRWSLLFPTGVKELGEEIRDPYWDAKNANTATLGNKYANLSFGTTIDVTKNWQIIADYTYDYRNETLNSSLPTLSLREPWYAGVPWLDENGDRVYVDAAGNVTDSAGIPGYRFPLVNYVTKDQSNVYQSTWAAQRHTVNAYSVYNLKLNAQHDFKFTLGTNIVANKWKSHWSRKTDLINSDNPQFDFAVGSETTGGDANWDALLGYFGRVNYAFKNKYLLEGNLRYDATSKFPADLRWKWYPSFSAGWVISDEEFMKGFEPVLSFAKFRGSWGAIGDQSVPNTLYMSTMDISKNSWLTSAGKQFVQLSTPGPVSQGITWQNIRTIDLGADLRFFKNKFGIVFDWYSRETENMIISGESMPATFGAAAPLGNYGNLRTNGWEVAFDFNHRFESGLGLNITANLSDAITMITKAPDWNTPWGDRKVDNTFTTGKRYGDIYGYVTDRLYQKEDFVYDDNGKFVQETIIWEGTAKRTNKLAGNNPVYQTFFEDGNQILLVSPGDIKFVDVNGDGYITPGKGTFGDPGDRVVIGNMMPRYEYGFRIALDYKSFDFSVMGQGVGKRSIWGSGQLAIPGFFAKEGAMPQAIAADYWRPDRTDAFYPRAWDMGGSNSGFVMVPQTRYLLNMAYFRVKNITLGYSVAENLLKRAKLKQARLYVSLENFITFDKLRGLPIDPEAISGYSMLRSDGNYNLGRTGASNPTFKIASIGINIGL
ncbi:SusC/RagA family TonB-linked outer membrane protein [Niabella beijingensis]|uniref:SusC/RagA family TonB-linked outer membrane protein n=1 Tax=Niabella beijingensis TaxID=2872700 RepID=UPI001CBC4768|nr:TonB-dependent receptor [Niabella beijingensis]MBZ4188173.1 TonB-dependent receptor [Niabella beijingensis]